MDKNKQKRTNRQKRHRRVRAKISGTAKVPRIAVFRSSANIYAQAIDDQRGVTIFSINDRKIKEKGKIKKAAKAGEELGETLKKAGISKILFDRGGYQYHGRVKALADGLRSAGLKF